jgi:hypothetical protein
MSRILAQRRARACNQSRVRGPPAPAGDARAGFYAMDRPALATSKRVSACAGRLYDLTEQTRSSGRPAPEWERAHHHERGHADSHGLQPREDGQTSRQHQAPLPPRRSAASRRQLQSSTVEFYAARGTGLPVGGTWRQGAACTTRRSGPQGRPARRLPSWSRCRNSLFDGQPALLRTFR